LLLIAQLAEYRIIRLTTNGLGGNVEERSG